MRFIIDDLKNCFDFFMRNHLTFSRKNYIEKTENLNYIFQTEKQKEIYKNLKEKYNINFENNTTKIRFLINLYYLQVFDKCLTNQNKENLRILDIGSKNWEYVKSEHLFFNSITENMQLNGIELDAYRLCTNFYSRYEIAKFYTKDLENTKYIIGDFLEHNQKYDYIIWILPFITEYPHIKWGLPLKYFKPEEMLKHAYNLLNNNGEMLIINQGEKEHDIQQQLNKELSLPAKYYGEIEDEFNLFKNKRYCCKITKSEN